MELFAVQCNTGKHNEIGVPDFYSPCTRNIAYCKMYFLDTDKTLRTELNKQAFNVCIEKQRCLEKLHTISIS